MTVHFIGAGPGAADLITLRGRDLLARCPVCLYAGSIVPRELLAHCPPGARIVDTAPLTLDEIEAEYRRGACGGLDVARLHSGDLVGLQRGRRADPPAASATAFRYTLTPGVPAFAAAAAALGRELTVPEVAQSVVLTRVSGRASAMPRGETLAAFGATGATLAHPSGDPRAGPDRGGADAALRRGLPGGDRGAGELAGRAHPARHAGDDRGAACGRAGRADGAGPGRAGAGGGGVSR